MTLEVKDHHTLLTLLYSLQCSYAIVHCSMHLAAILCICAQNKNNSFGFALQVKSARGKIRSFSFIFISEVVFSVLRNFYHFEARTQKRNR